MSCQSNTCGNALVFAYMRCRAAAPCKASNCNVITTWHGVAGFTRRVPTQLSMTRRPKHIKLDFVGGDALILHHSTNRFLHGGRVQRDEICRAPKTSERDFASSPAADQASCPRSETDRAGDKAVAKDPSEWCVSMLRLLLGFGAFGRGH